MDFIATLSRQPLFRLIGAILVLLLVDMSLRIGAISLILWVAWVAWGAYRGPRPLFSRS